VEYFWLCGDCSRNKQVTLDRNGLVVVHDAEANLDMSVTAPRNIWAGKKEMPALSRAY